MNSNRKKMGVLIALIAVIALFIGIVIISLELSLNILFWL